MQLFERLKTKIHERNRQRIVSFENEECIITTHSEYTDVKTEYRALSLFFHDFYEKDCCVYHYRVNYGQQVSDNEYCLLFQYQKWYYEFKIRVDVVRDGFRLNDAKLFLLDEKWCELDSFIPIPPELIPLKEAFEQAVRELPEFRLYHVTGLM